MKPKRCFFVLLFLLSSFSFLPLPSAEPTTPLKLKDNLFSVDFVNENYGWAVGYYGRILHTTDGGKTWVHQESGTTKTLTCVDFVDQNNGWVVGYGPTILCTRDGGASWVKQKTSEEILLTAVKFVTDKKGWIVGEFGTILYTEDGGQNWQAQQSGEDSILYALDFADELNGWAAGEFGAIFHTSDGGKTWQAQDSGVVNVFFSAQAMDSQQVWLAGIDSLILHSTDGGQTWQKVESGYQKVVPFYAVHFTDPNVGVVAGQGVTLCTQDGGASWKPVKFAGDSTKEIMDYLWLYRIASSSPTTMWMVGEKGKIFKSMNSGEVWDEITY